MPINVGQAIDANTGEKIYALRKTKGYYDDEGTWVEGKTTKIKMFASVQVPTKEELALFTGLERVKDTKMFWVKKNVKTVMSFEDEDADILVWDEKQYKAMGLGDWKSYGYQKVLGAKL